MTQPGAGATRPCSYCAELIQQSAALCRFCGRQVPSNCASIIRIGTQYALGRLIGGGFGVWELAHGSALVAQYPDNSAAWAEATNAFETAESNSRPTPPRVLATPARSGSATLIVLALLVGGYLLLHAYLYRSCIFTPSVLAWPSKCL